MQLQNVVGERAEHFNKELKKFQNSINMMAPSKFIFNLLLQVNHHNRRINSNLNNAFNKTPQATTLNNSTFKAPGSQQFTTLSQPPTTTSHAATAEQQHQQQEQQDDDDEEEEATTTSRCEGEQEDEEQEDEELEGEEQEEHIRPEAASDSVASIYKQFQTIVERSQHGEPLGKRPRRQSRFNEYDYEQLD